MNNIIGYFFWLTCIASCYAQSASRYTITTIGGSGATGFSGDGGDATVAQLASPSGVAVDASREVYIADQFNHRIRKIPQGEAISTVAGSATKGYAGDGAQAASAGLLNPTGVAVDSSGTIYIADAGNHVIRKVAPGGMITTVAGNNALGAGWSGDGGAATSAQLSTPMGVAVDAAGNLFVADFGNHRIRKVSPGGTITTIVGLSAAGFYGDGLPAASALLNKPFGVAVDGAGNLFIGDSGNQRVRKVSPDGIITTVAGAGGRGYSGDLGPATSANLNYPSGVASDTAGNLYIADNSNSRIRKVSANGTITTIAGNGRSAYYGDGGLATSAAVFFPTGIAVDAVGNVYITDNQNNVVRMLTPLPEFALPPTISGVIGAGAYGGFRTVVPGSWIEIYGSDLAGSSRSWTSSGFRSAMAPVLLDGTSVTIGGQPAYVSYISAGQVNALVPMGVAPGEQQIAVSTVVGTSEPHTIPVDASQPGLYAPSWSSIGGRQYAAAVLAGGTVYALPTGAVTGIDSRPARPGETITLYGAGFGPVFPNVPTGRIAPQGATLTGSLQVFFGETQAIISYAGLAPNSVGLYQFNIAIPNGVTGDAVPLSFTFNGVRSRQELYLAVGN